MNEYLSSKMDVFSGDKGLFAPHIPTKLERSGQKIIHMEIGKPDFDTPKAWVCACGPMHPGAPQQHALPGLPDVLRETVAAQQDTGVGVFDLEIIRIGEGFDPHALDALYDAGAALEPGPFWWRVTTGMKFA